jgi:hypothetical protein
VISVSILPAVTVILPVFRKVSYLEGGTEASECIRE